MPAKRVSDVSQTNHQLQPFLIHNAEPTADGESCSIAERLKFMTVQSEDSYEELQYGLFGRVVRRNPLLSQNNTAV